jgi:peptidoglycan/xylan/chitin deacetylase (PgdA/CDA1 family)
MADTGTYPRDMIGYGRTPPFADWPKRARIAVQFVVNYEEGGENNILHGDAASEAFLSEIVGAAPWPGMRHMNMESIRIRLSGRLLAAVSPVHRAFGSRHRLRCGHRDGAQS